MATAGPMVRDYTGGTRAVTVEVSVSAAYEVLLEMFTVQNRADAATETAATTFLAFFDEHASPDLSADLATSASCCELWLSLIGLVYDSRATDVDGFLDYLTGVDPVELRRRFMAAAGIDEMHDHSPDLIAAAATGDHDAIASLLSPEQNDLRRLLEQDPSATSNWVIGTVRRFTEEIHSLLPDVLPALQRDADEKTALAATMNPESLVERATNGITFRSQPDITGVVLIPSAVIRPWVVISDHGTLRVFCYPVADEHLNADPSAPPSYVVDFYKALGDEKRLRILAILAEGPTGLTDLTARLDLAKSTVHHHLRILRSAGFVRVTIGDEDKAYSLRNGTLEQAGALLQNFIGRLTPPTGKDA